MTHPENGSGSPGYRPFRLLHYDIGFEPSVGRDFVGRAALERTGTVNKRVNDAPQRSWAPGRRYDTPREGSGSPGYRPFRLLHYDIGFVV